MAGFPFRRAPANNFSSWAIIMLNATRKTYMRVVTIVVVPQVMWAAGNLRGGLPASCIYQLVIPFRAARYRP